MNDDAFWDRIEAAGVHLSYRHGLWYAGCAEGHYGPYANREDAVAGLVRALLDRLHAVRATAEQQPFRLPRYRPDDPAGRN